MEMHDEEKIIEEIRSLYAQKKFSKTLKKG